eukprot:m.177964 g.177964  ORF g.177964 m.177964 type:complete len:541 (-) comp31918_c0_seq12:108-1730(-)
MEYENHATVVTLIDSMVKTGLITQASMIKLKEACRSSPECIQAVHKSVMFYMEKEHAQVRLICLEIVQELFPRSGLFRKLTVESFQQLVALCVGLDDVHQPLPPPKAYAIELRNKSINFVDVSFQKWGKDHKQIQLAYDFLRKTHKINFRDVQASSRAAAMKEREKEEKKKRRHLQTFQDINSDYIDRLPEVRLALQVLQESFSLVVPKIDLEDVQADADILKLQELDSLDDNMKTPAPVVAATAAQPVQRNFEVTVSVRADNRVEVVESEDNSAAVEVVRDNYRLFVKQFNPWIDKCVYRLQKNTSADATKLLEVFLKLRQQIKEKMMKCDELYIISPESPKTSAPPTRSARSKPSQKGLGETDTPPDKSQETYTTTATTSACDVTSDGKTAPTSCNSNAEDSDSDSEDSDSDSDEELQDVTEKEGYEPGFGSYSGSSSVLAKDTPPTQSTDNSAGPSLPPPLLAQSQSQPPSQSNVNTNDDWGKGKAKATSTSKGNKRKVSQKKKKSPPPTSILVDLKKEKNNSRLRVMKKLKRFKTN